MTDVTIRGIDDNTYNEFSAEARRMNKSIGDLVTQAMRQFLKNLHPTQEGEPQEIGGLQEVIVSKKDLEEFGSKVEFTEIQRLIFDDDVDQDTFEKYVSNIGRCQLVVFPRHFPKLYAFTKCQYCQQVIRRGDVILKPKLKILGHCGDTVIIRKETLMNLADDEKIAVESAAGVMIADDVTPELADAKIDHISSVGKVKASPEVQKVISDKFTP